MDLKELRYCVDTFVNKSIPNYYGEGRETINSSTVPGIFGRFMSSQQLNHRALKAWN
jgi:hypothetical protein